MPALHLRILESTYSVGTDDENEDQDTEASTLGENGSEQAKLGGADSGSRDDVAKMEHLLSDALAKINNSLNRPSQPDHGFPTSGGQGETAQDFEQTPGKQPSMANKTSTTADSGKMKVARFLCGWTENKLRGAAKFLHRDGCDDPPAKPLPDIKTELKAQTRELLVWLQEKLKVLIDRLHRENFCDAATQTEHSTENSDGPLATKVESSEKNIPALERRIQACKATKKVADIPLSDLKKVAKAKKEAAKRAMKSIEEADKQEVWSRIALQVDNCGISADLLQKRQAMIAAWVVDTLKAEQKEKRDLPAAQHLPKPIKEIIETRDSKELPASESNSKSIKETPQRLEDTARKLLGFLKAKPEKIEVDAGESMTIKSEILDSEAANHNYHGDIDSSKAMAIKPENIDSSVIVIKGDVEMGTNKTKVIKSEIIDTKVLINNTSPRGHFTSDAVELKAKKSEIPRSERLELNNKIEENSQLTTAEDFTPRAIETSHIKIEDSILKSLEPENSCLPTVTSEPVDEDLASKEARESATIKLKALIGMSNSGVSTLSATDSNFIQPNHHTKEFVKSVRDPVDVDSCGPRATVKTRKTQKRREERKRAAARRKAAAMPRIDSKDGEFSRVLRFSFQD